MRKFFKITFVIIIIFMLAVVFGYAGVRYFLQISNTTKLAASENKSSVLISQKFNILIVPGHEVDSGGANYKDIYERDLVAVIASKISNILSKNGEYNIITTRDSNNWNPIFSKYFQDNKEVITNWKNKLKLVDSELISSGKKKYIPDMAFHSQATPEAAVKAYGINKWANENNIDLVLNLHFNDEQRPNMGAPGDLTGFVIFIPESQMKNSLVSREIGESIYKELAKIETPEVDHLLEDQSLIALGASGTLDVPSMLIEYSYIYEKMLRDPVDREKAIEQMAEKTALGIEDYIKNQKSK